MKWFTHMNKKELTREEQRVIIANRLEQAWKLVEYWQNISRVFMRGGKVNLIVDERPDEENLKS